jgi:phage-related protein (TIGR01555 family)
MEEEGMSKKKKAAAKARQVKTQDSFQNPLTRSGVFMPNALEATQYPLTRFSRDWQTINSLYRSHWVVRRIIDVIPEDMTKNGYKITTQLDPDAMKKLETTFRRTSTHAKLLKGLKWGRLYGGAGALIMIDGQEDMLDQPLELDQVMPDSYKGLLVLDRWSGITPNEDLVEDPGDPEYGLPKSYTITCDTLDKGIRVHHSRILRFMGRDLPYLEELAENYWGASELEHVIDELRKRDNVSWNIAMLTFMANLRVMKMDGMGMMLATGNENAQRDLYNTVQAMNTLMNNNSIQILGENDSYETHQYTFGGIADVYDRFMMDVAGAAETPVTKLFGRSPAGMNATGESDMQNYYDTIEEKQENELRPVYDKLLPIIMMSTFGAVPDDFDYDFNPVRRAPEDEMADLASKNTDSVTKAFQAGLISQKVALKELRQQSELTGMWTNITDEDIENADDEVMSPDEGMGGDMFGNPEQQPPESAGASEKGESERQEAREE